MELPGRVRNGVVVLEGPATLPEGATVSVMYPAPRSPVASSVKHRIQLPLVHCDQPGSVQLTSAQIAAILEAEDAGPRH